MNILIWPADLCKCASGRGDGNQGLVFLCIPSLDQCDGPGIAIDTLCVDCNGSGVMPMIGLREYITIWNRTYNQKFKISLDTCFDKIDINLYDYALEAQV